MAGSFVALLVSVLCFSSCLFQVHGQENALCIPANTPWSAQNCLEKCDLSQEESERAASVFISTCPMSALTPSNTEPSDNLALRLTFKDSGVTTVQNNALSGLTVTSITFVTSFTTFEEEAFSGFSVEAISFLNNAGLKSLPSGLFKGLTTVKLVSFINNGLTSLCDDAFTDLVNLEKFYLIGNEIFCLGDGLFQPLTQLKLIQLTKPTIQEKVNALEALGVTWKEDAKFTGICPQTFKGLCANVSYAYEVDICVVKCSDVEGLRYTESDVECDCMSYEGCIDNCGATDSAATGIQSPGNFVVIVGSVLSVIFHLGMISFVDDV